MNTARSPAQQGFETIWGRLPPTKTWSISGAQSGAAANEDAAEHFDYTAAQRCPTCGALHRIQILDGERCAGVEASDDEQSEEDEHHRPRYPQPILTHQAQVYVQSGVRGCREG